MDEGIVSLLKDLGMTDYQARVLYALMRLRESSAKQISELSGVPRTKVYEILEDFVRRGYVIEIDTRPKMYQIVDPHRILDMIVEEKKRELQRIERKAKEFSKIIPVLAETESSEGNYLLRLKSPEDLEIRLKGKKGEIIVGLGPRSEIELRLNNVKEIPAPFDFIYTGDEIYIPLVPFSEQRKERTVVVFRDKGILSVFRKWLRSRS